MFNRNRVQGVPRQRIAALRAVPFFEGLPDKVLARIDSHVNEIEVPAGDVLTTQGTGSYEAFIIQEGEAEVRIGGEVVRIATTGELIGELGVVQNALRSATVVATTPMRLLVLSSQDLRWLFDDDRLAQRVQQNIVRHQQSAGD